MIDSEKPPEWFLSKSAMEFVHRLVVTQEGSQKWDHMIRCSNCDAEQPFGGIESYGDVGFPDTFMGQVIAVEEEPDDELASKMCYYFFGWRFRDGKNLCPTCFEKRICMKWDMFREEKAYKCLVMPEFAEYNGRSGN